MPPFTALLCVAAGASAGAAATLLAARLQETPQAVAARPTAASSAAVSHPALAHGLPTRERVRAFAGHVLGYDCATRNPAWVLERLTKEDVHGEGDRKVSKFKEDQLIERRFRSKLSDYARSGYDRGHMAPAMNHKASQQRMDDTFCLSNMSPQVRRVGGGGGGGELRV